MATKQKLLADTVKRLIKKEAEKKKQTKVAEQKGKEAANASKAAEKEAAKALKKAASTSANAAREEVAEEAEGGAGRVRGDLDPPYGHEGAAELCGPGGQQERVRMAAGGGAALRSAREAVRHCREKALGTLQLLFSLGWRCLSTEWVQWIPRRWNGGADALAGMALRGDWTASTWRAPHLTTGELGEAGLVLMSDAGVKQDTGDIGLGWLALKAGRGELVAAGAVSGEVDGVVGDVEMRAVLTALQFVAAVALCDNDNATDRPTNQPIQSP